MPCIEAMMRPVTTSAVPLECCLQLAVCLTHLGGTYGFSRYPVETIVNFVPIAPFYANHLDARKLLVLRMFSISRVRIFPCDRIVRYETGKFLK